MPPGKIRGAGLEVVADARYGSCSTERLQERGPMAHRKRVNGERKRAPKGTGTRPSCHIPKAKAKKVKSLLQLLASYGGPLVSRAEAKARRMALAKRCRTS